MDGGKKEWKTIDEYIEAFPKDVQGILPSLPEGTLPTYRVRPVSAGPLRSSMRQAPGSPEQESSLQNSFIWIKEGRGWQTSLASPRRSYLWPGSGSSWRWRFS